MVSERDERYLKLLDLRREQLWAWRHDRGQRVEHLLQRNSDIAVDPDLAVDLIYSEFCIRAAADSEIDSADYLRRFPQYADSLARIFAALPLA